MKKTFKVSFFAVHLIFIILIVAIIRPGQKPIQSNVAFLICVGIVECIYLIKLWIAIKNKKNIQAATDIVFLIWIFLLVWEILVTQFNLMHPVLIPAPEDVFNVFATQYSILLAGVFSSLELLLIGFALGLSSGVALGLPVGWIQRLRDVFYPIANVLTPIPPVVFAPYLIAIMPSFRSASALVIMLGIFWPTFLGTIIRIGTLDNRILESAKVLNVNNRTMICKILFPYILPGLVSNLKVTLTTSVMMLTFAEMMGATKGMGFYIINYTHYANYTNVVAGFIVVGVVVTILNWLINKVQMNVIKWR